MMDEDKMSFHSTITPKTNVQYKFNYLYPEMIFVMLAINALVKVRIQELSKSKYLFDSVFDKKVIWDDELATVRSFQAKFAKCIQETLTENAFARWLNFMNSDYLHIEKIAGQYVDLQNIEYLKLSKEERRTKLNTFAKRIADFKSYADHAEIREVVANAAKERDCAVSDIRFDGIEYPENIDW
ncbi:MAG: hypothetical protein HN368_09715 [Spirochaetales bacterium]|nr:hypothetical protein [Spirochaetales bacterium]